mmetsp:Transcript_371/g.562  ORF Transcript_371/g.562 Transcript_371/m.562 type:complete len:332 (-) Transcript_371:143-1138(-)
MKVTQELILGSTKQKRGKEESKEQFLLRLTHVNLEGKGIADPGALRHCRNLLNLYLYDNQLPSMSFVSFAPQLTHLYLQNNRIEKIEGLETLVKLQKLYLDRNHISRLEGLRRNTQLEELRISKQSIPNEMEVDDESLMAISNSLSVLHCAGNKLRHAASFAILGRLRHLDLSGNLLEEFSDIRMVLSGCFAVEELSLHSNPLAKRMKYREKVIVMSSSLSQLDGKEILASQREFLVRLEEKKDRERRGHKSFNSVEASRRSDMGMEGGGVGSHRTSFANNYNSGGAGSTLSKGPRRRDSADRMARQARGSSDDLFMVDAVPLDVQHHQRR